ncbi:MAG: peptidoglycan DD-metalloendopeptidase family protein [Lachnospiraceae bacterium]|nr:peptidoglycan DD-metalloendopeptidase family protein [Lachnospiraceae bacterium]
MIKLERRNKGFRTVLLSILILVLAVLPAVTVLATSIQDAKDEKSRLEKRQEEIEEKRKELEAKKQDIVSYIKALDQEQRKLEERIAQLDVEIEAARQELEQTKMELEEAKQTVAEQYETMKKRIKYMYENGSADYIEIFLNAESIADLLNQAEYVSKIAEYDNELLERYEAAQLAVQEKEASIEEQLANLEQLSAELKLEKEANEQLAADKAEQVEQYNAMIDEANDEINQYEAEIAKQDDYIDRLIEEEQRRQEEERRRKEEEERKRQEEERRRQEEEQKNQQNQNQNQNQGGSSNSGNTNNSSGSNSNPNADANGQALLNGGLMWPLPSSTRITSGFGGREEVLQGSGTFHSGVDIGTPAGNNILASAAGTVVAATYHWSMGNYVLIDHGGGIYTVYMHSSKLLVSAGDYVNQGDVIALVGSTGLSTAPHLHFGLKINGSYVNPLNYVSY